MTKMLFGASHASPEPRLTLRQLTADAARGLFMGNRGGRIHKDARAKTRTPPLGVEAVDLLRSSISKIGSARVWGDGYTELFFLDEVIATRGRPPSSVLRMLAPMRMRLRNAGKGRPDKNQARHRWLKSCTCSGWMAVTSVHPHATFRSADGTMIARGGEAYAVKGDALLRWSPSGYGPRILRQSAETVDVLTPLGIVNAFGRISAAMASDCFTLKQQWP